MFGSLQFIHNIPIIDLLNLLWLRSTYWFKKKAIKFLDVEYFWARVTIWLYVLYSIKLNNCISKLCTDTVPYTSLPVIFCKNTWCMFRTPPWSTRQLLLFVWRLTPHSVLRTHADLCSVRLHHALFQYQTTWFFSMPDERPLRGTAAPSASVRTSGWRNLFLSTISSSVKVWWVSIIWKITEFNH